tara:strand:- start:408 stop:752 length:345 start_codon:yes stop_codon:yes gene_type:complete
MDTNIINVVNILVENLFIDSQYIALCRNIFERFSIAFYDNKLSNIFKTGTLSTKDFNTLKKISRSLFFRMIAVIIIFNIYAITKEYKLLFKIIKIVIVLIISIMFYYFNIKKHN